MAAFYLDNDVAPSIAALLHARGHAAVTALVYTIDAPALASGPPDGVLRDARGHQLIPTGGSGTCVPAGRAARMHCDQTIVFAPPAPGTPLRLVVTPRPASGRGALSGSGVVVSFRMP